MVPTRRAEEDLLAQLAPGAGQSGRAEREKLIKERSWEAENGLRNLGKCSFYQMYGVFWTDFWGPPVLFT